MCDLPISPSGGDLIEAALSAREAVVRKMARHGLSSTGGWMVSQRFLIDDSGNLIEDFVPVRRGLAGEPPEARDDLAVRVLIEAPAHFLYP